MNFRKTMHKFTRDIFIIDENINQQKGSTVKNRISINTLRPKSTFTQIEVFWGHSKLAETFTGAFLEIMKINIFLFQTNVYAGNILKYWSAFIPLICNSTLFHISARWTLEEVRWIYNRGHLACIYKTPYLGMNCYSFWQPAFIPFKNRLPCMSFLCAFLF